MVDVLLAVHNGEKYLNELLDSLIGQSYSDINIIVGDDNSSDGSRAILKEYAEKFPGKFSLNFFEYEKSSAKDNFLRLLRLSKADFVMFADQDDVWKKNKIEKAFCALKDKTVPALYHCDLEVTDSNLNTISPSMFLLQKLPFTMTLPNLLCQNNVTGCTVMINKQLRDIIKYDDTSKIVMHDWWLALAAMCFGETVFSNDADIFYRQHDENEVGAKDVESYSYITGRLKNTSDVKKNIFDTYIQAAEFLKCYGDELSDNQKDIVRAYSEFTCLSRSEKIKRSNKYGFWKNTAKRKLAQILWG